MTAEHKKQVNTTSGARNRKETGTMKQGGILDRVLKAIALAMGVLAVVLTIWGAVDTKTLIALLAVGLLALAISVF